MFQIYIIPIISFHTEARTAGMEHVGCFVFMMRANFLEEQFLLPLPCFGEVDLI